jgi:hypothetical protein
MLASVMGMKSVVVVVMVIVGGTGICQAQSPGPGGELLPLEWKVGQIGSGQPTITGHIDNRHVFGARGIQLLVEELDSSGRRVSQTIGYLNWDVPPGGRAYFEIRVPTAGGTYRVTLLAIDWFMQAP